MTDFYSAEGVGREMWELARRLFPINRSLTGDGVRQTLAILNETVGGSMSVIEVPTGTTCLDWTVPKEWSVRDAYIVDPAGRKFCEFKKLNLHLVGYSVPFQGRVSLDELDKHLYSLPELPDAVPFITSFYTERWGFCLSQRERDSLVPGDYQVIIDSELHTGSLTYGEIILPGESDAEILLSTYICHPSMANNELSGPVVTAQLIRWAQSLTNRRLTIRAVFIPETIGSIVYLSRHLNHLKSHVRAGFVVTCVGDDRTYSYLASRLGNTLADRVARHVLNYTQPHYQSYSFLERGSDERQYCSPGVDLPVVSVMRSKYGQYPEYHTSADNLQLISPAGLYGGFDVLRRCLEALEVNENYSVAVLCEPQLGRRGLYPTLSTNSSALQVRDMTNLLAYADGRDLLGIAETIDVPIENLAPLAARLLEAGLLTRTGNGSSTT